LSLSRVIRFTSFDTSYMIFRWSGNYQIANVSKIVISWNIPIFSPTLNGISTTGPKRDLTIKLTPKLSYSCLNFYFSINTNIFLAELIINSIVRHQPMFFFQHSKVKWYNKIFSWFIKIIYKNWKKCNIKNENDKVRSSTTHCSTICNALQN
jgi:hypothetical protein